MTTNVISDIVRQQREYFKTGQTKDVGFRIRQLNILKDAIRANEARILQALKADLNKPQLEAYSSEVGLLLAETRHALQHIQSWNKPRRMPMHVLQFPSSVWLYPEPYGVALIIAPWNYPFLLLMAPLVGAIAAGNCAVLKPSEVAPNMSAVTARIVQDIFDPRYITAVEGGSAVAQALLLEKFDYIFYTGNGAVGRLVMQAAAKNLTPVTLELGGKSPAIVDAEVDVDQAARRIAWGKFFNAGQICLAPDYVLVDKRVKPTFMHALQKHVRAFYPAGPRNSPDYCRIINQPNFERLSRLLPQTPQEGRVVIGGETDAAERYIAPTVIDDVAPDAAVMQEEIFGPLLPVIACNNLDEAIAFVNERPKPLALYFFSTNKQHQERVLAETSSGGGCINDTILHFSSPMLPFGGVGDSGMGAYRGEASFDTFSHHKAFIKKNFLIDIWFRYAPYKDNHRILKWIM
jgi:aldehyde dehydrogenase (NAD+)